MKDKNSIGLLRFLLSTTSESASNAAIIVPSFRVLVSIFIDFPSIEIINCLLRSPIYALRI